MKPDIKRGIKEIIAATLPLRVLIKTLLTLSIFITSFQHKYRKQFSFCQIDKPFAYVRVNLVKLGSVDLSFCGKMKISRLVR